MLLAIFHVFAVYVGTQVAQLEYVDIWRAIVVALLSYVVMFLVGLVLLPLIAVPLLGELFGVIILTLGTAFASKMVLSCDWKPAWIIGGTAGVLDALATFVLSGCSHI
jgi:hypothetical protein